MRCSEHNGWIEYVSRRNHSGAAPATLQVRYRPIAPAFLPQRGTLEHFLTERYCLYALDGSHRLKFGLFFWDQTWAGRFELINAWNDGPKNDPGSHNAEEHDLHSSECVVRNGLRANYVCDKKK
jgi:uncharacterized protein DUF2071